MNDLELLNAGPPEVYDNTMLGYWCKCPRSLYFFLRRIDSAETAAYFTFGRAWGAGLNTWHSTQGEYGGSERQHLAQAMAEEEWNKDSPTEYGDNTLQNLNEMLALYRLVYGDEELWTYPYKKGELGFAIPLPETPFSYGGSIDAPIQWKNYGIFVREDKTTGGYITESFLNQWDHASQIAGYIWAVEELLGKEIAGCLVNIASKKKRKAGDENLRFSRPMVKKSSFMREKFVRDTKRLVKEVSREWDLWQWPRYGERDPINCAGGMGRSACTYRRICLLDTEPWDLASDHDFGPGFTERGPWEPWGRTGGNE